MQNIINTYNHLRFHSPYNRNYYKNMTVNKLISLISESQIGPLDNLSKKGIRPIRTMLSNAIEANNVDLVIYICNTIPVNKLKKTCFATGPEPCDFALNPLELSLCQNKDKNNLESQLEIQKILLEKGIDPIKCFKRFGINVLEYSLSRNSPAQIALLAEYGAHISDEQKTQVATTLWKINKIAFTFIALSDNSSLSLPTELMQEIKKFYITRIAPGLA